ncbi:MAG: tRNA (adenosine(37)-N6)-threonylcarbamoyltransferase complex transferase subunit TsaD [Spirochaetaceae bacterium]|nr:MAG: tRNA (adenosine(37)-N6)-threonylcarbamoyltransferase complex transferase subunit TsaD [Spirochaetaceae bacterium]
MTVLGIETSCDECSVAVVVDGVRVLGQRTAVQLEEHAPYRGVVPEIASRTHTQWIVGVYHDALAAAGIVADSLDAVAVTTRPGLVGSLVVGLSFAKALAYGLGVPLVGVDHILAHLYAPQLSTPVEYPFVGLLVSGGHTMIVRVNSPLDVEVLGTTIDDAIGEAFDKVAKYYDLGYPGGVAIDRLAQEGDPDVYRFPDAYLHKGDHRYDVSYSGLKTAVINQRDQFRTGGGNATMADLAAGFQRAAVDSVVKRTLRAVADTGLATVVVGGGVAANSYLRASLDSIGMKRGLDVRFPPMELCSDNGAMIAGLGYHLLGSGRQDGLDLDVAARVSGFRRPYP